MTTSFFCLPFLISINIFIVFKFINLVFINELEEKIGILKEVDIEQKKAEDMIKSIVNESRKK